MAYVSTTKYQLTTNRSPETYSFNTADEAYARADAMMAEDPYNTPPITVLQVTEVTREA